MLEFSTFTLDIKAVTDAHAGDGNATGLSEMRPDCQPDLKNTAEDGPLVQTLARGAGALARGAGDLPPPRPILPSTSIKGALKSWHVSNGTPDELVRLFGTIKDDDTGDMGRFSIDTATLLDAPESVASELPYWDAQTFSWIATHVAVSRTHGSADPKKLYFVEMLPAGARFRLEGIWFGPCEEARQTLPELLSPFASGSGLHIGSGSGTGSGLFAAETDELNLARTWYCAEKGRVFSRVEQKSVRLGAPVSQLRTKIQFACPGPFLSLDPSRRSGSNHGQNRMHALKRAANKPVLHAKSVAGALRSRAAWLCAEPDDPYRKPGSWADPSELTPVEHLFGVSGWKGRLMISVDDLKGSSSERDLASIAIDRFSGAVLESTLFEIEYFHDVSFVLSLHLNSPGVTKVDQDLLDQLISSLITEGLRLGHATNRGFGWFSPIPADAAGGVHASS